MSSVSWKGEVEGVARGGGLEWDADLTNLFFQWVYSNNSEC